MDVIDASTLAGREGETFRFGTVAARLAEVRTDTGAPGGFGALTAVFVCDEPHGLDQTSLPVTHPELATTDLFVVPSSPRELCVTITWFVPSPH